MGPDRGARDLFIRVFGLINQLFVLEVVWLGKPATARVAVFVVNRHPSEAVSFSSSLRGFEGGELVEAVVLADDDLTAANTQDDPDRVVPQPHPSAGVVDGVLTAELPPASWSMFLLQVA